jgi:3-oxoacyl-[acyl-carrier-protein] synthase II
MTAVTGMAWITPLGDDLDSVWQALLEGRSGFVPLEYSGRLRNELAAPCAAGAELSPSERLARFSRQSILRALAAARVASEDPELRLVIGTSLASWLDDDAASRASLSAWARSVAHELGLSAPPIVVSTACSAGSDAIMVGAELIRAGLARYCVCGGADVLTTSKRLAHSALGTMSPTNLRAFDVRHDGTLLGEGAGFMVLESSESCRKQPLALLRGCGSANDASGMTAADVTGLSARYAIERSLEDAGMPAAAIGVIKAHGSGTVMNDTTERNAFASVFTGASRPIVFGTKGNFGHSLGATGAIEAIATVLALRKKQVPPVCGLEQPDPEFPLRLPYPEATSTDARVGLSLTLGFGGFDTSLVFEAV